KEGEFSMMLSETNSVPLLKVSFINDNRMPFDFAFYRQLGVDFRNRWSEFREPTRNVEADAFYQKLIKVPRYCLVANQCSWGQAEIDVQTELPIFTVQMGMTKNLLDWVKVIKN